MKFLIAVWLLLSVVCVSSEAEAGRYGRRSGGTHYSSSRGYYTPGYQGSGRAALEYRGPRPGYPARSVTRTSGGWMRFSYGNPVQWDIGGVGRMHYPWLGIR